MKLLFDQNLSPRLVKRLADLFPDCSHVSLHALDTADDIEVWEFARNHNFNFAIVTKDSDFSELSTLRGFPPKVVWLQIGNCTTAQIENLLRSHEEAIRRLETDASLGILELQ
jgi:predicted nuclease of predicted toxin-antitoxin system